ncbi:MAG: hypothetical protein ACLSVD_08420 [Eggerthellaceae bacterium]
MRLRRGAHTSGSAAGVNFSLSMSELSMGLLVHGFDPSFFAYGASIVLSIAKAIGELGKTLVPADVFAVSMRVS